MRHLPTTLIAALLVIVATSSNAGAPTGRYAVAKDTVLDMLTGLTWQRPQGPDLTLPLALAFCAKQKFGDQTGWRLPSIKELQSLVDERAQSPAIDGDAFPDTLPEWHWSSTASYVPSYAWAVDFADGHAAPSNSNYLLGVRCVR